MFTVLMYGLFAAVSVQKSVRDRLEGLPVTNIYYGLSWLSVLLCLLLMAIVFLAVGWDTPEGGEKMSTS